MPVYADSRSSGEHATATRSIAIAPPVSLITSWDVSAAPGPSASLSGLRRALLEGIETFDLYFLSDADIPWYCEVLGRLPEGNEISPSATEFAASLTSCDAETIAKHLRLLLIDKYAGRHVGRRPRILALATYFPDVSHTDEARRTKAVKALRASVTLAHHLGCKVVEAVGGRAIPPFDLADQVSHDEYVANGIGRLARSFVSVYDAEGQLPQDPPAIAWELEPGPLHLLASPERLAEMRRFLSDLHCAPRLMQRAMLNVDIGHAFLIGYDHARLEQLGLAECIAHMHISDHAGDVGPSGQPYGSHSCDLVPGTFHRADHFADWIKVAVQRANDDGALFAGIAVELEATCDVSAAVEAVATVRRWVRNAAVRCDEGGSPRRGDMRFGAILNVDIGNSTQASGDRHKTDHAYELEGMISAFCHAVHNAGGAVVSYTGDGLIALFERVTIGGQQGSEALAALDAARGLVREFQTHVRRASEQQRADAKPPTLRIALHTGEVLMPSAGKLRDEAIGEDIVCVTRLCDHLSKVLEPALERSRLSGHTYLGATDGFYQAIPSDAVSAKPDTRWTDWGEVDFKGLGRTKIYVRSIAMPSEATV